MKFTDFYFAKDESDDSKQMEQIVWNIVDKKYWDENGDWKDPDGFEKICPDWLYQLCECQYEMDEEYTEEVQKNMLIALGIEYNADISEYTKGR